MQPLKTFIVEDSPVIRDNLIAALEELAPVKVVGTAESEADALEWLGQADHRFDLVIIDIFLKGGSGLGVLRHMNGIKKATKLVVLTNYATPDMRKQVPRTWRRQGVRQVRRDRCADPVLLPAGGRRGGHHRSRRPGLRRAYWIKPFFSA